MVVSSSPATDASSWRPLYRAGALSTGLAVVLYIVALVLVFATDLAPTSGGADMLGYIDGNRTLYIVKQVLWLFPSVLLMVTFLALAVALMDVNRSWALISGVIGVASWAGTFAWPTSGEGSFVLVMLSDRYASASTEAERAALVASAETMMAYNDAPAALGVMQALGVLLVSGVMLRGVFPRGLAWLGVATGAIGIICEALRPWLGIAYSTYGVLLFIWMIWATLALWRLANRPDNVVSS